MNENMAHRVQMDKGCRFMGRCYFFKLRWVFSLLFRCHNYCSFTKQPLKCIKTHEPTTFANCSVECVTTIDHFFLYKNVFAGRFPDLMFNSSYSGCSVSQENISKQLMWDNLYTTKLKASVLCILKRIGQRKKQRKSVGSKAFFFFKISYFVFFVLLLFKAAYIAFKVYFISLCIPWESNPWLWCC